MGQIRNAEGDLILNVGGVLTNEGTLVTQPGIGNAFTTIDLGQYSIFTNTGLIETLAATTVPVLTGNLKVAGSGLFVNGGTLAIDAGNLDMQTTGALVNSGYLDINTAFYNDPRIVASAGIVNTGTLENHNDTTIQWGGHRYSHFLLNTGLITNLYDFGQLTLAASASGNDYGGVLVNNGQISAQGGGDLITIAAPVVQSPGGEVTIAGYAGVKFDTTLQGGMIKISSGMLDFATAPSFARYPTAAPVATGLALDGSSATINFDADAVRAVFANSGPSQTLQVYTATPQGGLLAAFALSGSYHQSQFTSQGHEVIYTKDA